MWQAAGKPGTAIVATRVLPDMRGVADSRGATRAGSKPAAALRALLDTVGGAVAALHLLRRAKSRAPRIAGSRRPEGAAEGGDVHHLQRLSQVHRNPAGVSCFRVVAPGSGNSGAGPGRFGSRIHPPP